MQTHTLPNHKTLMTGGVLLLVMKGEWVFT